MEKIYDFLKRLSGILKIVGETGVFIIMILMVANILLRALFNNPIDGIYDIEGMLFVITVALPLAYVAILDAHVYVDFFVDKFSQKGQRIINVIINAVSIVFFSAIAWKVIDYGNLMKERGRGMMTTGAPLYPFFYIIAGGIFLLVIVLFFKCFPKFNEVGEEN